MSPRQAQKHAAHAGCWKRAYVTRRQADAGAREQPERPLHAYECKRCGLWHLTSQLGRDVAKRNWQRLLMLAERRVA